MRRTKDATGRSPAPAPAPGLAARRLAATVIADVIEGGRALDETLDRLLADPAAAGPGDRDAALVRAIATVGIRHFGAIRTVLMERLPEGMPGNAAAFPNILVAAVAQLLWMDVPDHAAVDLAVRAMQEDRRDQRYVKLGNAVLRRVGRERDAILAAVDPLLDDTPTWLRRRWTAAWGDDRAARIAAAHAHEPAVDLTVKDDPEGWAQRLDALLLPTGSLRLRGREALAGLDGFAAGAWWVQDAAAALPARLLRVKAGERAVDLCAAPGGKTAQLAAAGATVTAVDRSAPRLARVAENLARLGLKAELRPVDALTLAETGFDAVLLDAPCSATGTLRRHPDVAWTKGDDDLGRLVALQRRLLDKAATLLAPGGRLVYCTCSLEPEEGEAQIAALLQRDPGLARDPIGAAEIGGLAEALTAEGDLRTFPFMLPNDEPRLAGMDGFYAARLVRR